MTQTAAYSLLNIPKRHHVRLLLGAILVAAALLRLWNFDYDRLINRMPLAHDSFAKLLLSENVMHGDYKPLHFRQPYYLIYTTGLLFRCVGGGEETSELSRWKLTIITMIFYSLATILVLYSISRLVFRDRYTALLSCFLIAVAPVSVVGSRYFKEDTPLMFFVCLAMLFVLLASVRPRWYFQVAAGLSIGTAAAVKYAAFGMVPFYILAHVLSAATGPRQGRLKRLLSPCFFLGLVLIPAAFLVFNPHVVSEWDLFRQGFVSQSKYAARGHNDGTAIAGIDCLWTFYLRYAIVPGLTAPVTIASIIGLLMAVLNRNRKALFVAGWMLYFYLGVESSRAKPFPFFARYIHALFPFLCMFAAFCLCTLYRRSGRNYPGRILAIAAIAVCCMAPLARTSLINAGIGNDTRITASTWIDNNIPLGATICLDDAYYSPRPSQDKFTVIYTSRMYNMPPDALKDKGVDYVVLNSFRRDRYRFSRRYSAKAADIDRRYAALEQTGRIVREFKPKYHVQTYGFHNPIITIYQMPWAGQKDTTETDTNTR